MRDYDGPSQIGFRAGKNVHKNVPISLDIASSRHALRDAFDDGIASAREVRESGEKQRSYLDHVQVNEVAPLSKVGLMGELAIPIAVHIDDRTSEGFEDVEYFARAMTADVARDRDHVKFVALLRAQLADAGDVVVYVGDG